MGGGLVPSDKKSWQLIQGYFGGDIRIAPFIQEIFLLECHIAGTGYRDLDRVEPELAPGDPLLFKRELDNIHDHLAVAIYDQKERKLGYLPRAKNEVPARLMDAGKLLFGKIETSERIDQWLKITVRVYMKDL
ncbi:MAG: restriction endonuclease [Firmicutes bacterium]|nr:restriction endonuclease [Bacillota bacterium]